MSFWATLVTSSFCKHTVMIKCDRPSAYCDFHSGENKFVGEQNCGANWDVSTMLEAFYKKKEYLIWHRPCLLCMEKKKSGLRPQPTPADSTRMSLDDRRQTLSWQYSSECYTCSNHGAFVFKHFIFCSEFFCVLSSLKQVQFWGCGFCSWMVMNR